MSGVSIKIRTGKTKADTLIKFEGKNVELIKNKDRETFKIADRGIKNAVKAYVGCLPDDVYVRRTTPWGDVFSEYNWDEVRVTLQPIRSRVLGVRTKPVIVSKRVFKNNSRVKAKYKAEMSHSVEETFSRTWSKSGELTQGKEFDYQVKFGVGSVGGKSSLSFTKGWGIDTSKTKTTTLTTTTGVEVPLEPNQAVEAILTANHGTLELEIDYQATLSGVVFANFSGTFKGHHFWGYPINEVLKAGGLPQCVNSTERISIGYYSNAHVEIRDK